MNIPDFEDALKKAGAATVGYADMSPVAFAAERGLTTGISITLTFTRPELARKPGKEKADPGYIESYYDFCSRLDPMAEAGVEFLRAAGYKAEGYGYYNFFDQSKNDMNPEKRLTARFQHKTCATHCRLGWNSGPKCHPGLVWRGQSGRRRPECDRGNDNSGRCFRRARVSYWRFALGQ